MAHYFHFTPWKRMINYLERKTVSHIDNQIPDMNHVDYPDLLQQQALEVCYKLSMQLKQTIMDRNIDQ